MYVSRVKVKNYRNFACLDVNLKKYAVIVGPNKAGKTNLIGAIRLAIDPDLPPNARRLAKSDFWDGDGKTFDPLREIEISVQLRLENDDRLIPGAMVQMDPPVAQFTYRFRPKSTIEDTPTEGKGKSTIFNPTRYDFDWLMGPNDEKPQEVRLKDLSERLAFRALHALRDTEGALAAWSRSPLRPLLESLELDRAFLEDIAESIQRDAGRLTKQDDMSGLINDVDERSSEMVGDVFNVGSSLDIVTGDADDLLRSVQIYVDGDRKRQISQASLGALNVLYFSLLLEEMSRQQKIRAQQHTIITLEEPEAHVHPHIQRSIFRYFRSQSHLINSLIVTTHSPHVASVAPLESLVVLRDEGQEGTKAHSVAGLFTQPEIEDLERYLDVTRSEIIFARGVILVEGIAELYIVPAFAQAKDWNLDKLGISVIAVHGTDFHPFVRLVSSSGFNIPWAVLTDGDSASPFDDEGEVASVIPGIKRGVGLAKNTVGATPLELRELLDALNQSSSEAREKLMKFGVFVGENTLELDMLRFYTDEMIEVYSALVSTEQPKARFAESVKKALENDTEGTEDVLRRITAKGKGRFAQKLARHLCAEKCPPYIQRCIEYITGLVKPIHSEQQEALQAEEGFDESPF